jgi:hypothetical protein
VNKQFSGHSNITCLTRENEAFAINKAGFGIKSMIRINFVGVLVHVFEFNNRHRINWCYTLSVQALLSIRISKGFICDYWYGCKMISK